MLDTEGNIKKCKIRYHTSCYKSYTNSRQFIVELLQNKQVDHETDTYTRALTEVEDIINDAVLARNDTVSMSHLLAKYEERLEDMEITENVYMNRFKDKIVIHYGSSVAFAQPSSRETEYIYNSKMEVKDMLESFLNKIPHDPTEIGTKPCYLRIHTLTIGLISYGL